MSYSIAFAGDGRLRAAKGAQATPDFSRIELDPKTGRYVTEYVPGYQGLSFSRKAWQDFDDSERIRWWDFKYPDWTCDEYDAWKKKHGTPTPTQ